MSARPPARTGGTPSPPRPGTPSSRPVTPSSRPVTPSSRPVTPSSGRGTPEGRTATPIPAPIPQPVPTPAATEFRAPTTIENDYYIPAYPNLEPTGRFKVHPSWRDMTGRNFNCFAWSLGFTDRWVEGRAVAEMDRVYHKYFMQQCTKEEAEVDVYRILDAPTERQVGRNTIINKRAWVMHAARRGVEAMDAAPNLGCSSKMADQDLILHNRKGVEDTRGHAARRPPVNYGTIYQYWKKDPTRHPSFPGNEGNPYPPQGHFPDHRIFEQGTGKYPPGHPGNSIGAPSVGLGDRSGSPAGGRQTTATALPTRPAPGAQAAGANRVVSSGSVSSKGSNPSSTHSRTASDTSASSVSSGGAASLPAFKAESKKVYPNILEMLPYAKIPSPSPKAVNAAKAAAGKDAALAKDFETKWDAWSAQWFATHTSNGPAESVDKPQFEALVKLGAKIMPLVVNKLASSEGSFPGVYLYNRIETSKDFRVAPSDYLNFCVLQRQAQLIVDMNEERLAPPAAAARKK